MLGLELLVWEVQLLLRPLALPLVRRYRMFSDPVYYVLSYHGLSQYSVSSSVSSC